MRNKIVPMAVAIIGLSRKYKLSTTQGHRNTHGLQTLTEKINIESLLLDLNGCETSCEQCARSSADYRLVKTFRH